MSADAYWLVAAVDFESVAMRAKLDLSTFDGRVLNGLDCCRMVALVHE
jgi:hypothetical protein